MKVESFWLRILVFSVALSITAAAATHETLIHVFNGKPAKIPVSGFIADPAGNLFGVTLGTVYELSPISGGGWQYHTIATLPGGLNESTGGNLVRDPSGNLYGGTVNGGANLCGSVYELSPHPGAPWSFKVLHEFDCRDGADAAFTMVLDASGNLYGDAFGGGAFDDGIVFELSPGAGGSWTYRALHDFSPTDGNGPMTGLIFDSAGNLYGANQETVFKLTPGAGGTWTESTAYAFINPVDGFDPMGDLIFDSAGNLYATNSGGGSFASGTAFELSPTSGGGWTSTVLHAFNLNNPNDGAVPFAALTRDAAGNLYGTTLRGGSANVNGIVFKLSLVNGHWRETILHSFAGAAGSDGAGPQGSLYLNGNALYGVTPFGGDVTCNCGIVFVIH
jgi:uncharacterized repeat protein (TIGR03803 family)